MNVAVLKTKAEQALVENFEIARARLPGRGWVDELRAQAIGRFAALGLPHKRMEEWKYTDVRERLREVPAFAAGPAPAIERAAIDRGLGHASKLDAWRLVFIDGHFAPTLSDLAALPACLNVRPLADVLEEAPDWLAPILELRSGSHGMGASDAIDALNLAFMSNGIVATIGKGVIGRPLLMVLVRTGGAPHHVAVRNVVRAEAGAEATIIETHVVLEGATGRAFGTFATDLDADDGARVAHVQCVSSATATEATHLARWNVRLGRSAVYRGFHLTSDVALARNEVNVTFAGRGAKLDMSGCFLGRGSEHIDETLVIDHAVPGCESRELFKAVLDGRSRGVFQGKVIVRPHAQKTDGKQMARALMLSPDAEFDSKPELEIYADDVVCGHGSTAAELDADLLFYLRSRGIPNEQARALLIESFVGEAFDQVEDGPVREALAATAIDWLYRKGT